MAVKTWTGAGLNSNWNNGANWSGGTVPTTGGVDDIIFDGAFPVTGTKNCLLNIPFNARSVTFTSGYLDTGTPPYNGTFTFGANLTITSGILTLGAGTTYSTNATPTTHTLAFQGVAPGLISNNKILPVNLLISMGSSNTLTFTGNADFQGNLSTATSTHNIKAFTGTTVDLRIGGNITVAAMATNVTDHVTIKGYGTAKTFNSFGGLNSNMRVSFVSGSTYTSSATSSAVGASFLTVEALGQFNAVSAHSFSGSATLSGFNSTNNSDFFALASGFAITINTDIVIKSSINIPVATSSIVSSGASKLLLEGNFTSSSSGTVTIDRLEFSGTTASNITAVTTSNLQVKEFIINKTGAGSVNFNSNGIFGLFVPSGFSYSFVHTSGTVTQNSTCIVRFWCNNAASTMTYSQTDLTFRYLEFLGGILNLNSQLLANTLRITPQVAATVTSITSSTTFGFNVENLLVVNTSGAARPITLKSTVVYDVTVSLIMITTSAAATVTLNASSVGVRAIFNLSNSATQTVEYVNATDIDSSGTGGVLPYSKQTIYSLAGVIAPTTINWGSGSQPPPLAITRTVAHTFVS
jgi:hypothetical protein